MIRKRVLVSVSVPRGPGITAPKIRRPPSFDGSDNRSARLPRDGQRRTNWDLEESDDWTQHHYGAGAGWLGTVAR